MTKRKTSCKIILDLEKMCKKQRRRNGRVKMDELEVLVNGLEQTTDEKQIENKLQEILKAFLSNYYVEFGTFKIDPILIEAYYYDEHRFPDSAVHAARNENGKITAHARERQKDNFKKLYIHNVITKDDGLDVCLSKGDYYFSILIKNAIINDKHFAIQSEVSKIICGKCQGCDEVPNCIHYQESVLKKHKKPKDSKIIFLPRKNVLTKEPLAAVSLENIRFHMAELSLAQGYGQQWEYSVIALSEVDDPEKAKKLADKMFGSSIEDKYFELAKESLNKE